MKILFAVDPWIYRDVAGNQIYTLENVFAPAIKNLMASGHDVKVLVGEDTYDCIVKNNINISADVKVVLLQELYKIYPNHYEAHKIQFNNLENQQQIKAFSELIRNTLGLWCPDVLISFTTPVSAFKKIYTNTLCLQFENGIFSRSPYPWLCQLDPFGFLRHSYPAKFAEQLRNQEITKAQKERLMDLRNIYKDRIFNVYNPFSRQDLCGDKYQRLLLVPLSYNGVVINDEASIFKSQLDFLLHVLYKTPKNTRVLVTKHSLQMNRSLHSDTEIFLQNKFPNLLFSDDFDKYAFASQWLTPLVDGVVSLNSTVAYHAAFWGKKVFSLGDCEINSVGTSNKLDNMDEILAITQEDTRALNVLYHLLTRYCFLLSDFLDADYITSRFSEMMKLDVNDWTCMPLIEKDEDTIFKKLLQATPGLNPDFKPRVWDKFKKEK